MQAGKRRRLQAAGWKIGSAANFLGLSAEEAALVDMKIALSGRVKTWRNRANMTQAALAKRLRSSQSRVAKIEAGDPAVSLDLLVRASLATGAKRREIAAALAPPTRAKAS